MSVVKVGDRFGKLTVVSFFEAKRASGATKTLASCLCDCGAEPDVEKYNLSSGNSTACMECKRIASRGARATHGHSYNNSTATNLERKCYYTWQAIKRRCRKEYDSAYYRYGAVGIDVSDDWHDSYESFYRDMGLPSTQDCQIDRIDNNKGYFKGNCRWVSRKENARNKSNNRIIEAFGESKPLCAWADDTGVKAETISRRIDVLGWKPEDAMASKVSGKFRYSTPDGDFNTVSELARYYGMSGSGVSGRIDSDNYPRWTKTQLRS